MFEFNIINELTVEFIFIEPFSTEDMKKVLTILISILEKNKPFSFYVDTRNASIPPINASKMLVHWMRENKPLFKKYLICSAIILNDNTSSILIKNLLNGAFKIQPPTAPNRIFTNFDNAMEWINKHNENSDKLL